MIIRIFGAFLIIGGCTGVGFAVSGNYRRQERAMEELLRCLQWMSCELNYRIPPLPVLCRSASEICQGPVSKVMLQLADELDRQLTPDVATCIHAALSAVPGIPDKAEAHLRRLGKSLGRFDLQEQIASLEAAMAGCRQELETISGNREVQTRNYQTLGLCAGAALVIIFL